MTMTLAEAAARLRLPSLAALDRAPLAALGPEFLGRMVDRELAAVDRELAAMQQRAHHGTLLEARSRVRRYLLSQEETLGDARMQVAQALTSAGLRAQSPEGRAIELDELHVERLARSPRLRSTFLFALCCLLPGLGLLGEGG